MIAFIIRIFFLDEKKWKRSLVVLQVQFIYLKQTFGFGIMNHLREMKKIIVCVCVCEI